jgi:hypothetical protein
MKVMSASFRKLIRGLKDAGRDTQMPYVRQQAQVAAAAGGSSSRWQHMSTPSLQRKRPAWQRAPRHLSGAAQLSLLNYHTPALSWIPGQPVAEHQPQHSCSHPSAQLLPPHPLLCVLPACPSVCLPARLSLTRNGSSSSSRLPTGLTAPSTSCLFFMPSANWERCRYDDSNNSRCRQDGQHETRAAGLYTAPDCAVPQIVE